jgi:hypothetical protein
MDTITQTSKNQSLTRSLTQAVLLEWFRYEPDTGLFYWRKRPSNGGWNAKVGDMAGSVTSHNRRHLWLGKKRIYGGRAAYIMTHGDIPDNALVDHIDGNTLNDRIDNLRLASAVQNTWNRIGTTSKGVARDARGQYKPRIMLNGRKINLGTWATEAEAHAAYMGAAAILHGEFWVGNRPDRVYSHPSSPEFQRAASEAIGRA